MQYSLKQIFNYVKIKDVLHFFLACFVFPFAIVAKIFVRKFYLICEDRNEARDNGYRFFKWIRENEPKIKVAYAIDKRSPDREKVKSIGKVINFGGIAHWFWYVVADKNISSQKDGKPNAAVCYFFEVVLKLRKNNRVFLQHGVIKDALDWLYYKNTYMRYFVAGAKPEYDFIEETFGYPKGHIIYTGLARFDSLHNVKSDKGLILVMPTWREWLGRESRENKNTVFTDTP
ncbi:MAG TPA: teichoic acid biosynthesis protein B, partial [Clostridiales bacterium]|nr:teichoic acid biosynthesis protein B [Clostridiales bacterium]